MGIICMCMGQDNTDGDDEMTELERELVTERVKNLDESNKCSVEEFLEEF